MSIEIWLAFSLAAAIVLVIPGPTIILVLSQALACGRRSVLPLTVGVALGDLTAMTLSFVGLGAVLLSSAALFTVLKWCGAIYLIYLGVHLLLLRPAAGPCLQPSGRADSRWSLFRRAYVVTALNPKSIIFFLAFMPQFLSGTGGMFGELLILGGTFLVLAAVNAALYGLFAGRLGEKLHDRKLQGIFNKCGAGALIGAGICTAALGKSS